MGSGAPKSGFWGLLDPPGGVGTPFWGLLGPPNGPFGAFWDPQLGANWGLSGPRLGPFGGASKWANPGHKGPRFGDPALRGPKAGNLRDPRSDLSAQWSSMGREVVDGLRRSVYFQVPSALALKQLDLLGLPDVNPDGATLLKEACNPVYRLTR